MRVQVTREIAVDADHDAITVRLGDDPKLAVVEGEARQLGLALIAADAALEHDRLAMGRLGVEFEAATLAGTGPSR